MGKHTEQDIDKLNERAPTLHREDPVYPISTLHLFPSFDSVQENNDFLPFSTKFKFQLQTMPDVPAYFDASTKMDSTISRRHTGNLETVLHLKVAQELCS